MMNNPPADTPSPPPGVAANAGFAMFAKVFYLMTRLLLPPLVLSHVPLTEYGLWSACFVLIMYIGLTDVGFSNVYVRFVARFHAQGDTAGISRLVSTGIFTLSLMASLAWIGLWLLLPAVLDFLKVDAGHRDMAKILVSGTAAMFLLDLSLGAYCYLLHGLQRIREEQKVAVAGYVLELTLIAVFLQAGLGIYSLLAAFVARYAWSLAAFIRMAHRFMPTLSVRLRHYDPAMLRHFFGFGLAVQASALLGTALFSIDRVIAGFLLGPAGVALFELGAKLPVSAISVPSAISNATMPAASQHAADGNHSAIIVLYAKASRATCLLAGLPLGFLAVFAAPIALGWLGPREELAQLPLILALTALWSHLHIVTGPGSAVFRAMGQVGNEFVYHGLRIAFLGIGTGLSMDIFGASAEGLIVGLSAGSACAALAYMLHNQRRLGLKPSALLRDVLAPGFVVYPAAASLLAVWQAIMPHALQRWETLASLLAFGLLYSALCISIAWRWLLRDDERSHLLTMLPRFSGSFPKWRNI